MRKDEIMEFFKMYFFMTEDEIDTFISQSNDMWYFSSLIDALQEVNELDIESSRLKDWISKKKNSLSSSSDEEACSLVKDDYVSQLKDSMLAEAIKRKNSGPKSSAKVVVVADPNGSSNNNNNSHDQLPKEKGDELPKEKGDELPKEKGDQQEKEKLDSEDNKSESGKKGRKKIKSTRNRHSKPIGATKSDSSMSSSPPKEDLSAIICPWIKKFGSCPIFDKQKTCPFGGHNRRRSLGL